MKWIFEVSVQAKRNKSKIMDRIIERMADAAMKDKQTKMVDIKFIEEEEDDE